MTVLYVYLLLRKFVFHLLVSTAMQLPAVQIIASLAVAVVVTTIEPEKDGKKSKGLQIGVKKRVDPDKCTVKSKKGDTLHMHYTVSTV